MVDAEAAQKQPEDAIRAVRPVVILLVAVSLFVIVKLFGVLRRLLRRVFRRAPEPSTPDPRG